METLLCGGAFVLSGLGLRATVPPSRLAPLSVHGLSKLVGWRAEQLKAVRSDWGERAVALRDGEKWVLAVDPDF